MGALKYMHVYKDPKRQRKRKRETKNNSLPLLWAKSINKVYHVYWEVFYVHFNLLWKIVHKGDFDCLVCLINCFKWSLPNTREVFLLKSILPKLYQTKSKPTIIGFLLLSDEGEYDQPFLLILCSITSNGKISIPSFWVGLASRSSKLLLMQRSRPLLVSVGSRLCLWGNGSIVLVDKERNYHT